MSPAASRSRLKMILIALAVAAVVIALLYHWRHLDWQGWLVALVERVDAMGWVGPVLLFAVLMLLVPLMIPNTPLELGAGLIFPLWLAIPLCVLAETCGAAIAFFLARHGFGRRFESFWNRDGKFQTLIQAFEKQAWRGIALTRLIMGFPFKASNWAFGMSRIPPRDFLIGTFLGVIPRVAAFVYCGSLMKGIADLAGSDGEVSPARRAVLIGGIVVSLLGLAIMAVGARRVLARAAAGKA